MNLTDIQDKEDISVLVERFYTKVLKDDLIGHFFTEVVSLSWEIHIPILVSFWNGILFGVQEYKGNPMIKHIHLDKMYPIEEMHFERWLRLWDETVKENFTGPKSEEAIKRAADIGRLMLYKIHTARSY